MTDMLDFRQALTPWLEQLPPGADDPAYTRRYRKLVAAGHHPAIAAILANHTTHGHLPHEGRVA